MAAGVEVAWFDVAPWHGPRRVGYFRAGGRFERSDRFDEYDVGGFLQDHGSHVEIGPFGGHGLTEALHQAILARMATEFPRAEYVRNGRPGFVDLTTPPYRWRPLRGEHNG